MAEQFVGLKSSSLRAEIRTIKPCPRLEGEVVLPGDKSISHPAVILNSLAKGKARIDILLLGEIASPRLGV